MAFKKEVQGDVVNGNTIIIVEKPSIYMGNMFSFQMKSFHLCQRNYLLKVDQSESTHWLSSVIVFDSTKE